MAEVVTLIDDMDGINEGVFRHEFNYDGEPYTIDLYKKNWDTLAEVLKMLDEFAAKATKVEVKHERRVTALSKLNDTEKAMLRKDLGKGPRGTIPDEVVEKWVAHNQATLAAAKKTTSVPR